MEKYTVVIPTKNNAETLLYTLKTCLRQTYPNFQIIVSDNFSDDGTRELIENINDPRLHYILTPRPLSMTENFEFALSHAKEGFIMCIGSDDGLMPGAIEYVDGIVKAHSVKAVSCQYAHYMWPNVPVPEHGRLILNGLNVYKNNIEIRKSVEWIKKTLDFKASMYVCDLPNLYYGFVHRSIIDKAIKDGKYFRSITPDAYSAFATAINTEEYAFSNRPFSIAGISRKSNGLSQMLSGDIAKSFLSENIYPIHKDFAFCSAIEVIMCEAYAHLADAFPEKCQSYKIDFGLMLSKALASSSDKITHNEVFSAVKKMSEMHNLNFEKLKDSESKKILRFGNRTFQIFKSLLLDGSKYLGMKDSLTFSIQNIDDAAIVLGVLASVNAKNKILKVKDRFWGRIKDRLFSTTDSI